MKKLRKYRLLVALLVAVALTLAPFSSAGAATTATVTITATPSYIGITVAPTTWTMSVVLAGTDYWGNLSAVEPQWPLVSGECTWQVSSTSSVNYYLDIKGGNMTGGTQWTLETVAGVDDFTLIAGGNSTANLASMTQLSATYQNLAGTGEIHADSTIDLEMRMETPTEFGDGVSKSGTVTILAATS